MVCYACRWNREVLLHRGFAYNLEISPSRTVLEPTPSTLLIKTFTLLFYYCYFCYVGDAQLTPSDRMKLYQ